MFVVVTVIFALHLERNLNGLIAPGFEVVWNVVFSCIVTTQTLLWRHDSRTRVVAGLKHTSQCDRPTMPPPPPYTGID